MEKEILISCIIPCSAKDYESQNLKDLIASIKSQDFPQDKIEILTITEGDSEQAKAIGIRRAKGEICAMFCADNLLCDVAVFKTVKFIFDTSISPYKPVGVYSKHYQYKKEDNSLNRYFSLMGCNDVIAFYLKKCDRKPYWDFDPDERYSRVDFLSRVPSLGDNGFFFWSSGIKEANIDNYYPMDVAEDLRRKNLSSYIRCNGYHVWHRTSGNLISFLKKRYRYARDLYSDRSNRRWKMVETNDDLRRLGWFIVSTLTVIPCLGISFKGFLKVRDLAWAWHWPVCFGFLITYGILTLRNICLVLLSSRRLADLKRLGNVLSPSGIRPIKTSR